MNITVYRITQRAIIDLEEIWNYTYQKRSEEQADRYYQLLIQEFDYIAKYPTSGKSVDYIRRGYRISIVKSHLIFYRLIDSEVEIVRILHQSMDVKNRF